MKLRKITVLAVAIAAAFGAGKYYDNIKPAVDKFIEQSLPAESAPDYTLTADTAITLVRVSDGDSFVARFKGINEEQRVRLYGIDAPELNQPYGRNSKEVLEDLLRGRELTLQIYYADQYDRKVAVLMADDINVNQFMLEGGNVWYYGYHCKEYFCTDWKKAEQKARDEAKGLWKDAKPVAPWKFRSK